MDHSLSPPDEELPPPSEGRLWRLLRDRTFRSLRHRDYRLYFFGQLVSFVGSWMQSTALMWFVYDLTSDPLWPALLLIAFVGPTLLIGPLAGSIADRVPKRTLILTTQSCFLTTAILLTLLVAFGLATPIVLLFVQLANGCIQAVDLPGRLAFVPDLIPKADLINAVSLNAMLFNSARFLGPALTGVIYFFSDAGHAFDIKPVTFGALVCFCINAISYAAVLVALSRISVGRTLLHGPKARNRSGMAFAFCKSPPASVIRATKH